MLLNFFDKLTKKILQIHFTADNYMITYTQRTTFE